MDYLEENGGEQLTTETMIEADHPTEADVPAALWRALNRHQVGEPAVGQVWRLTWGELKPRFAMIIKTLDAAVVVLPVTLGSSHRVDAAQAEVLPSLDVPVTVWPQLRTGLGDYVLRELVDEVPASEVMRLAALSKKAASTDDLTKLNADLTEEEIGVRRAHRDRLAREFAAFSDADWNEARAQGTEELFFSAQLAADRGAVTFDDVERMTNDFDLSRSIWEGDHPVDPEILDQLTREYGDAASSWLIRRPDVRHARAAVDMVWARPNILLCVAKEHRPEEAIRNDLYRQLFSLAARETGASETDYQDRLRVLLRSRLKQNA